MPYRPRLIVKACGTVVQSHLVVILCQSLQHIGHLTEHLLLARSQVKLISAAVVEGVKRQSLPAEFLHTVLTPHEPQHGSLQCQCFLIVRPEDEASVQLIQGIVQPTLPYGDFGCLEVARICLSLAPCGFPEQLVGLVIPALILQRKGKVVDRLAVVWVGVTLLRQFHSLAQILLCLTEASPADIPQSELVEATDVVGVTAQGFLVVVNGIPRGMTVLLQVQAGEIELLIGLYLLRQQGGLSAVGYGAYLVALCMPLHDGAFLAIYHFAYHEIELIERRALHVNSLCQHLFRAYRHHLIIICLSAVTLQFYAHFLL